MQNIIGQLAAQEVDVDNLKKQLLRHQTPVAMQVTALIELIKYQKSLMPDHLIQPFVSSIIDYVNKELEQLK